MSKSTSTLDPAQKYKGQDAIYYKRMVELRDDYIEQVQALSEQALKSSKEAGEELADVGSDNFMREIELDRITEESRKIQLLQDGIKRLEKGEYGTCEGCESSIEEMRLEALPWARYCLTCKRKQEEATL
jgi:DnaK suppressor protein